MPISMVYWVYKRYWSMHVFFCRKHYQSNNFEQAPPNSIEYWHNRSPRMRRAITMGENLGQETRDQSNLPLTEKLLPFQSPRHKRFLYNQIPKTRALDLPPWGRPIYFMGHSLVSQPNKEVKFLSCSCWRLMPMRDFQ